MRAHGGSLRKKMTCKEYLRDLSGTTENSSSFLALAVAVIFALVDYGVKSLLC